MGKGLKLSIRLSGHEKMRPDTTSHVHHGTSVKALCTPTLMWHSVKKSKDFCKQHLSVVILSKIKFRQKFTFLNGFFLLEAGYDSGFPNICCLL